MLTEHKIQAFNSIEFTMSSIKENATRNAEEKENVTHKQEKDKSVEVACLHLFSRFGFNR